MTAYFLCPDFTTVSGGADVDHVGELIPPFPHASQPGPLALDATATVARDAAGPDGRGP